MKHSVVYHPHPLGSGAAKLKSKQDICEETPSPTTTERKGTNNQLQSGTRMSSGTIGIPNIPIYSGKVEELEVDTWKRAIQHHFRFLSTYQKITITDADQVILVASLLTGRAAAWWDNQNRIHPDPVATYPTIDALTAAMKQYFEPPTQRL